MKAIEETPESIKMSYVIDDKESVWTASVYDINEMLLDGIDVEVIATFKRTGSASFKEAADFAKAQQAARY